MTSSSTEGLEQRIALLPHFLQQVTNDVAESIEAIPNVDQRKVVGNFVQNVARVIEYNRVMFCTGGIFYETLRDFMGKDFTRQPFAARYEAVVQTDALPREQKEKMVNYYLEKTYAAYQVVDSKKYPATSQASWKAHVDSMQKYHGHRSWDTRLTGSFPGKWWFNPTASIGLPTLVYTDPDRHIQIKLGHEDSLKNSELSTQAARATGILLPDESLAAFVRRSNIKEVSNIYRAYPDNEGLILAEIKDEKYVCLNTPFRDRKAYYSNISTKYPGIQAAIIFDSGYARGNLEGSLEELITRGDLTPIVLLKVPMRILLSIDNPKYSPTSKGGR